ncbi:MAG TPA: cytochrome c, partial [Saprospiraceae bacterium]|nr:cytochrome c [Saprospiraceae bacterium]
PNLAVADPETRLPYVAAQGVPFLQGTTFAGIVNRTKFYNGDYQKKYGDLVFKTRDNIREAIQLCAVACSQGRELKDWELESILAYFWELEWKMGDLDLSDSDYEMIAKAMQGGTKEKAEAARLIHTKYLDYSPATFIAPPENRREGNKLEGNVENGKLIYDLSCLHCHADERYSFFELDHSQYSFEFMDKHFPKYDRYSAYQVIRWGTSPATGKKAYMPNYTLEKMSRQQIEDLRAYIHAEAM